MVGARLEDCAKWLARGLSIEPNGIKWPQHKKATIKWQLGDPAGQKKKKNVARQSTDHAGQKIKSWRGNQGIAPAKRKIAARQSMDCAGQKKKIHCAHQLGYCAGLFKNNSSIAPASSKFVVRQSGYRACLFEIRGRLGVSCQMAGARLGVLCQMAGARLDDCAKWLAQG
jgi:hypothetical protein